MNKMFRKFLATILLAMIVLPASTFASGYTQTRYPIVLVHGVFGTSLCEIIDCLRSNKYSIGSSIVMICPLRVVLK